MNFGCQSMVGEIGRLLLKHPKKFKPIGKISITWAVPIMKKPSMNMNTS